MGKNKNKLRANHEKMPQLSGEEQLEQILKEFFTECEQFSTDRYDTEDQAAAVTDDVIARFKTQFDRLAEYADLEELTIVVSGEGIYIGNIDMKLTPDGKVFIDTDNDELLKQLDIATQVEGIYANVTATFSLDEETEKYVVTPILRLVSAKVDMYTINSDDTGEPIVQVSAQKWIEVYFNEGIEFSIPVLELLRREKDAIERIRLAYDQYGDIINAVNEVYQELIDGNNNEDNDRVLTSLPGLKLIAQYITNESLVSDPLSDFLEIIICGERWAAIKGDFYNRQGESEENVEKEGILMGHLVAPVSEDSQLTQVVLVMVCESEVDPSGEMLYYTPIHSITELQY
jgi:hypothetical protein